MVGCGSSNSSSSPEATVFTRYTTNYLPFTRYTTSYIQPVNHAPVAVAGSNQTVFTGALAFLTGSGSDLDGDFISFLWQFTAKPPTSSASLSCSTCPSPSFTADKAGTYSLQLSVHDGRVYSDHSILTITATNPVSQPGDIVLTLPFPAGISWIGDIAYDATSNTIWFLAGNNTTLDRLVQIDTAGNEIKGFPNSVFWLNHGSELTFDGTYLWATSYGTNGTPQSFIYKINPQTGTVISQFACPASSTGGYCEGIVWDGTHLWSAASDNKNLVSYGTDGIVNSTYTNFFGTIGTNTHLFYKPSMSRVIAMHDSIYIINPSTGASSSPTYMLTPHSSGWDGQNIWRTNNTTQEIEVVYVGL